MRIYACYEWIIGPDYIAKLEEVFVGAGALEDL